MRDRDVLMRDTSPLIALAIGLAFAFAIGVSARDASAQAQGQGRGQAAPQSAQAAAPIDLTGYWVSIVTEDWRWRMVTPPKGDYSSVPLSAEGRRVADTWDPAKDEREGNACRAYGAAGIMRVPGRVHITWENENTLKIETDAGTQTRLLRFGDVQIPTGDQGWQGFSKATWEIAGGTGGGRGGGGGGRGGAPANPPPGPRFGSLKVVTSQYEARLSEEKRGALQRDGGRDGVFRSPLGVERRRMVHGHDDRRRCEVSEHAVHHEHVVQEGTRRGEVAGYAMYCSVGLRAEG